MTTIACVCIDGLYITDIADGHLFWSFYDLITCQLDVRVWAIQRHEYSSTVLLCYQFKGFNVRKQRKIVDQNNYVLMAWDKLWSVSFQCHWVVLLKSPNLLTLHGKNTLKITSHDMTSGSSLLRVNNIMGCRQDIFAVGKHFDGHWRRCGEIATVERLHVK